jgi:hypothetical protein
MPPPAPGIARLLVPEQQLSPSTTRELLDFVAPPQTQPPTLLVHPTGVFQIHPVDAGVVNHPDMSSDQAGDVSVEVHG